jgi:hypothetical protein
VRRLVTPSWYRRHSSTVGYLVLVAAVAFIAWGVYQHADDRAKAAQDAQQRSDHTSCVAAKDTRKPLIAYLTSQLELNRRAKAAGLLPPTPPALRKIQAESLHNLHVLLNTYKDRQATPCPPAPS